MSTLTYSGELTVVRCWCSLRHAIPREMRQHQLRAQDRGEAVTLYCPLGHQYVPTGPSRAEVLERQLEDERRRLANRDEDLRAERASHAATKGQLTKVRKRAAGGACPCCNRTFVQLTRHMATKHPDFDPATAS